MADTVTKVTIDADIAKFREAMRSVSGLSAEAADKMVKELAGSVAKMEKASGAAAKKAAKEAAQAAKEAKSAMDRSLNGLKGGTEQVLGFLGGSFGEVGQIVLGVGEKLGTAGSALGAFGALAGGSVAAVAGFGLAMRGIADAALAARDRLVASGQAATIPPEALASLRSYEAAGNALTAEIDRLTISVGSDLAGGLAVVVNGLTGGIAAFRDVKAEITDTSSEVGKLFERFQNLTRVLTAVASLGISEVVLDYATASKEASDAQGALLEAERKRQAMITQNTAAVREYEKRSVQASKAHAEALKEEAEESARVRAEMLAWLDVAKERETAWRNHVKSVQAQEAAVAELDATVGGLVANLNLWQVEIDKLASSAGTKLQSIAQHANDVLGSDWARAVSSSISTSIGLLADANEKALEMAGEQRRAQIESLEAERDAQIERLDNLKERGTLSQAEYLSERKRVNDGAKADKAAVNDAAENEREAMMRSWRRVRALQIAGALAEGARSAIALLPAFAALGPFAPAAALAVSAPATVAAVAAIRNVEPPEFPMGRSPDHTELVSVRPDEPILNPRAGRMLGKDAVDALNAGQPVSSEFVLQVDGRTLATAVSKHLRGGAIRLRASGAKRAGQRPLYAER